MKLSLTKEKLLDYLAQQISGFFPDGLNIHNDVKTVLPRVIERLDYCFSQIQKKYFFDDGQAQFNHLNSDHYAMFLYFIANEAYRQNCLQLAERAFLLNKAMHGIDAFYSITLPDVFLFVHPLGTVLGNAQYADFLVVYQNVTVGSDIAGDYPVFGKASILYSKSSVIGRCHLGDNVSIASHAFMRNLDVPNNAIVAGLYPDNTIKKNSRNNRRDFFESIQGNVTFD